MTALGDEQKENSFSFSRRRRADNQSVGLVDTHCHLHDREFFSEEQAEEMLKRAKEKNVKKIICIGTSHEDSLAARDFAINHDNVYWTYGIHPEGATEAFGSGPRPSGPSPWADGAKSSLRSHVPRGERAAALRNPPRSIILASFFVL